MCSRIEIPAARWAGVIGDAFRKGLSQPCLSARPFSRPVAYYARYPDKIGDLWAVETRTFTRVTHWGSPLAPFGRCRQLDFLMKLTSHST